MVVASVSLLPFLAIFIGTILVVLIVVNALNVKTPQKGVQPSASVCKKKGATLHLPPEARWTTEVETRNQGMDNYTAITLKVGDYKEKIMLPRPAIIWSDTPKLIAREIEIAKDQMAERYLFTRENQALAPSTPEGVKLLVLTKEPPVAEYDVFVALEVDGERIHLMRKSDGKWFAMEEGEPVVYQKRAGVTAWLDYLIQYSGT